MMPAGERQDNPEQEERLEELKRHLGMLQDGEAPESDDHQVNERKALGFFDLIGGVVGFLLAGVLAGPFLIFSCIMFYGFSVVPISNWVDARSWDSVDCTIVKSDFTMEYTYEWEGTTYTSNLYNFASDFVHLHDGENEPFAEGAIARCFVNPNKPDMAILSKAFSTSYFRGCLALPPIVFFMIILYIYCILPLLRFYNWQSDQILGDGPRR
jgi:hypothetical protein